MITRKELREIANNNNSDAFEVVMHIQRVIVEAAGQGKDGVVWEVWECDINNNHFGRCNKKKIPASYTTIQTMAIIQMLKDAGYKVKPMDFDGFYLIVW